MREFKKPNLILSICLEFCKCRYNGEVIRDDFIKKLSEYTNFIKVCPEVEIGLGVPRNAVRLIKENDQFKLLDSKTGENHTDKMKGFAADFIDSLNSEEIEGFIAKNRSPSCGSGDSKVYSDIGRVPALGEKVSGMFTSMIVENLPMVLIENEGRLKNFKLRENFLIQIFMLSDLREVIKLGKISKLIEFHSNNKYLIMSYNQKKLNELGSIIASYKKGDFAEIASEYRTKLIEAVKTVPGTGRRINMLQHIFGYVSKNISARERQYFLNSLEDYREERIPFSLPLALLRSWVIRFEVDYLLAQTIFYPYPENLIEVNDSGKGRI